VTNGEAMLEARGLVKSFGGIRALDDVSVTLRRGEIRGLIGANGAGKSTLVKALAGEGPVDEGQILLEGQELRLTHPRFAREAGLVMMPQELAVAPNLTVAENIMLGVYPRGPLGNVRVRAMREEAARALRFLGVDIDLGTPVGQLAVVDQRLVMAARALAVKARLVMFDEPTAAMAPHEVGLVVDAIRALSDQGVATLYVSHRLEEVVELCDAVTAMREGRVIADLPRGEATHGKLVELLSPEREAERAPRARTGSLGEPVIRVSGLSSRQLHDVNAVARAGEILGVAGLLGSGARELLLAIAGLAPYDDGAIECDGKPLRSGDPRVSTAAGVGYLPGDRSVAVLPSHSVGANAGIAALGSVATAGFIRRRREEGLVSAWLERVHLHRPIQTPIAALSGGNQQKGMVARWLAKGCMAMLLDDPTVGVDLGSREQIHVLVREYSDRGRAVLVTSTDIDELAELSDRVLVFTGGAIRAELSGDDVTPQQILATMTAGQPVAAAAR
jgi:ABC-type sugar transport system ATPase subunit